MTIENEQAGYALLKLLSQTQVEIINCMKSNGDETQLFQAPVRDMLLTIDKLDRVYGKRI